MVEVDDTGDEEDAETWQEAMDEMEDPWMREPSGRLRSCVTAFCNDKALLLRMEAPWHANLQAKALQNLA